MLQRLYLIWFTLPLNCSEHQLAAETLVSVESFEGKRRLPDTLLSLSSLQHSARRYGTCSRSHRQRRLPYSLLILSKKIQLTHCRQFVDYLKLS